MVSRIIISFLLFASLFVEGVVFPFPFVFILGSILLLFYPDAVSFILVFIACLLLDIVMPHHTGATLLFVFGFQLLLFALKKPLALEDPLPKIVMLFAATILYQIILGYPLFLAFDFVVFLFIVAWVKLSEYENVKIRI